MRPHIIGIAGPSSSGKTELARHLVQRLPGTSIVSLDSYYRDLTGMPAAERAQVNFDHPDSLDWELLHVHLQAMVGGRAFEEPVYSFEQDNRTNLTKRIEPSEFVIVEGLFVLYWPELRDLLDTKVYVNTHLEVCFERRMRRDVAERGRTPEASRERYEKTVLPSAQWFVLPTIEYADLVVSGEEPLVHSTEIVLGALHRVKAAAGAS